MAYVPQDPGSALNPSLRIRTQLHQAFKAHSGGKGDADARIETLLEEVNLPASEGYLDRYPHQLSGGAQAAHFLSMAAGAAPPRCTPRDTLASVLVSIAAEASLASGRAELVPDVAEVLAAR